MMNKKIFGLPQKGFLQLIEQGMAQRVIITECKERDKNLFNLVIELAGGEKKVILLTKRNGPKAMTLGSAYKIVKKTDTEEVSIWTRSKAKSNGVYKLEE